MPTARRYRKRYKRARKTYKRSRKTYRSLRRRYRKHKRFGRRGSFRKRVTRIISKNLGLHTSQSIIGGELKATIGSGTLQPVLSATIGSPIFYTAFGILSSGQDTKRFAIRGSYKIWLYNVLNTPCIVRGYYFKVKRDIPVASYASYSALLQDDAPTVSTAAYMDLTTSNAAQRYLKFISVKERIIYPGKMTKFTLKKKLMKTVTGDVDANTSFLARRGNRIFYLTAWGAPLESDDGIEWGPGPVNLKFMERIQAWWNENDDATNTSAAIQLPIIVGSFDQVPAETTDQAVTDED